MNNLPPDPNQPISSPIDPGSSGSTIKGSEGGVFPESASVPETPSSPETQTSPEIQKLPEKLTGPIPKTAQAAPPLEVPKNGAVEPTQIPNIVDKTDQLTTLHEIKEPKDKLTKEADEEEEHFIEEVEKHHGDL